MDDPNTDAVLARSRAILARQPTAVEREQDAARAEANRTARANARIEAARVAARAAPPAPPAPPPPRDIVTRSYAAPAPSTRLATRAFVGREARAHVEAALDGLLPKIQAALDVRDAHLHALADRVEALEAAARPRVRVAAGRERLV